MKERHKHRTPFILRLLLFFVLPYDDLANLSGDFEELYNYKRESKGIITASVWVIYQIIISAPGFIFNKIYWGATMLKNYILTTVRTVKKQKLNSLLNVFGLAIAIASCLIIYSHIQSELSYEEFYPKAERIYRLDIDAKYGDMIRQWTNVPPLLGSTLKDEFPEVENVARLSAKLNAAVLKYESPDGQIKSFEEKNGFYVDQPFIDIFDLNFISGNPEAALENSGSIILTETLSQKYFGSENPVGKSITDVATQKEYIVTGLIADQPDNTHLQFEFLVSMKSWFDLLREYGWGAAYESRTWKAIKTYVLVKPGSAIEDLRSKMPEFSKKWHLAQPHREETFLFQPIKNIHMYSHRDNELTPNSDIAYVYIFSIIAIFILIIAAVNFINISLAQVLKRYKEVGVRKAIGAHRKQIFNQFIGESFVLTIFSALASIIIVGLFLPVYNNLSGKYITLTQILTPDKFILMSVLITIVSLAAGFYPALFVAKLPPSNTFSDFKNPKSSVSLIRKGLVIVQFVISVFMIIATITVYQQLQFFKEKDLGYDKEGLIAVKIFGEFRNEENNFFNALKKRLENYSDISSVSYASNIPGQELSVEHLVPQWRKQEDMQLIRLVTVDEDYIKTLGIELTEGSDFTEYSGDELRFIISNSAAKILELENPLGAKCWSYRGDGEIIGLIKEFNYESLHNSIEPLVLEYRNGAGNYLLIKCTGKNVKNVIQFAETEFNKIVPDHLFNYTFVSDDLERLYQLENNLSDVFQAFAILSILISCLGLFGLSVYTAELKIKEVGIRKVLGASTAGITTLLSKEFIIWIVIANVIAWPLAYYFMNQWLSDFAYRIEMNYWIFIIGGLLSLAIALLTVSYQSIKAALSNPVDSLRTE
ncbi:ABC transporter permease [Bacteroidota bacterium]